MSFWRLNAAGASVAVKVQPGARRPGVLGLVPDTLGTRLKIAVTAPPEDGRANRAVCAAMAAALDLPAASITVRQGATSRHKTLAIEGDPAIIAARLAAL